MTDQRAAGTTMMPADTIGQPHARAGEQAVCREADAALAEAGPLIERALGDRRRDGRRGGRRAEDVPGNAWTVGQVAHHIGMSQNFVLNEIRAKELAGSQFGRAWRIARAEVTRYCGAKGWPLPD